MLCKDTGFDGRKPLSLAAALTSAALTAPFAIAKHPWVLESEDTSYSTYSFKGCSCTCSSSPSTSSMSSSTPGCAALPAR